MAITPPITVHEPPFPRRLAVGVLALILVIAAWFGYRVLVTHREWEQLRNGHLRSKEAQAVILHLDELLTMSARMAVATRDPRWAERYQSHAPRLQAAIHDLDGLFPAPDLSATVQSLLEANDDIMAMERQAMTQAGSDPQTAAAILAGPLYADRKARYSAAARAFHAELDMVAKARFERLLDTSVDSLAGAAIAMLATAIGGMLMTYRLRRWQTTTLAGVQELQAAEARLQSLRRQNELILHSAAEGIYGLDLAGRLTFINPAAAAMLGWPQAELIGQPMHAVLHHGRPDGSPYPEEDCPIHASLHDGRPHQCADEVFWRRDGSHFPVEYASNPIIDGDRIVGVVVTFSDITERRERERLQAETSQALSQTEVLKNQFLSMVSHELRTPVSVILSSANILSFQYGSYISDGQRQHVDKITRASQRLMSLLADLLDATQIQAGTFLLHRRPVQLATVVDEALESIEHVAAQRCQTITRSTDADLPEIAADPHRLVQVLSNLLHNASKFTPTGGTIAVSLQVTGTEIRIAVQDSGPGIDRDKQSRLFQRFSRVGEPVHAEGGSMGLGLFIGKALVEAHGGRIGVDSSPGGGSCFWFTVPITSIAADGDTMTSDPGSGDR